MKLFKRQCIRKVAGMSLKSLKGKFKFKMNIYMLIEYITIKHKSERWVDIACIDHVIELVF